MCSIKANYWHMLLCLWKISIENWMVTFCIRFIQTFVAISENKCFSSYLKRYSSSFRELCFFTKLTFSISMKPEQLTNVKTYFLFWFRAFLGISWKVARDIYGFNFNFSLFTCFLKAAKARTLRKKWDSSWDMSGRQTLDWALTQNRIRLK